MAPPQRQERVVLADESAAPSKDNLPYPTSTSYAYGSFPAAQDATTTERGPLLPSHHLHQQQQQQAERQEDEEQQQYVVEPSMADGRGHHRRLRW